LRYVNGGRQNNVRVERLQSRFKQVGKQTADKASNAQKERVKLEKGERNRLANLNYLSNLAPSKFSGVFYIKSNSLLN
jgi:hypothetical protein